jgi:hypothetical protein
MITFLAWVTVIYALVLVVVLAVSLIAILYYLWNIGTTLSKISGGLGIVRQQTAPLNGQIEAINGALSRVGTGLGGAREDLVEVNAGLASLVGEQAAPSEQVA